VKLRGVEGEFPGDTVVQLVGLLGAAGLFGSFESGAGLRWL